MIRDELERLWKEIVQNVSAKKDEQQDLKAKFLKKLAECTSEEEKKKLMDENDVLNDWLLKDIDKIAFDGALLLESKAADIWRKYRLTRDKQLKDMFAQQEKDRDAVEWKLKDAEIQQWGQLEDQTIEDVVK